MTNMNIPLHPAPAAGSHAVEHSAHSFRYRPVLYFSLTFLVTFVLWFIGAYLSFRDDGSGLYMLVLLPGLLAPFLISLVFIFGSRNRAVKQDFLNRLLNPRLMRLDMLPAMLLLMPFAVLVSTLLSLPFGGSLNQLQLAEGFSFSSGFVPVLLLLIMAATFEELGWRGYAFDSLESRYTYLTASVIFGVLWSLWHFPLVFVHNSYQYEIIQENIWYGINFFVGIVPLGIIISWFCIKNGKSVIAAILFHFVINMSQEALNITQTTKSIETGVLAIIAIAIIAYDRELFFSKVHLAKQTSHSRTSSL